MERVLLDRPLVLEEFIIVKLVLAVLKNPSGVKRSRAMMSLLSKTAESN